MIDRQIISYLRLAHGGFNFAVMVFILYQATLGLGIRRTRRAGGSAVAAVRSHRRLGPVLAAFGVLGFLAGKTIVYLDHGHFLEHPLHYAVGATIALSLITSFIVSGRIRSGPSVWRTVHFVIGLFIVLLYIAQVFIGLGVLL